MPRKSRIDAPGALHHIIARGIERSDIFKDDTDCNNFIDRLGVILPETGTICFAWALLPNHFHLLLKTGQAPIATAMRRLLTGYAVTFNRRHRRYGHLFQNRYKSILCQEDAYLLELVRYIHLNPLRAKIVADMDKLDAYPFCGHAVMMGKAKKTWQDFKWILKLFDGRLGNARRNYRTFVQKGIPQGRRGDLIGGGLIRSAGGWAAVKTMRRLEKPQKADERILGDGGFVEQALAQAQEQMEKKYALQARGYDLNKVATRVSHVMCLELSEVWAPGRERKRVEARSLLCYWAVREVGLSMSHLSKRLHLSLSAVSLAVKRGEQIIQEKDYLLIGN
jgi:REP element-mobilizing transposase RayT